MTAPSILAGPRPRDERGVGTVLVAAACMALLCLASGLFWAAATLVVRHQVHAAADLAALSGATQLQHGLAPCDGIRKSVEESGLRLVRCEVRGRALSVQVQGEGPRLLGYRARPTADAFAGPTAETGAR